MSMRILAVVLTAACSSSSAKPAAPTVEVDPHDSREALVRSAFAALAAGDEWTLHTLADVRGQYGRHLSCAPGAGLDEEIKRVQFGLFKSISGARGLGIELLDIGPPTIEKAYRAGDHVGDCTVQQDLTYEKLRARVRVTLSGHAPVEASIDVSVYSVDGRVYLRHLASGDLRLEASTHPLIVDGTEEYAKRICACSDKACAETVDVAHRAWIIEIEKSTGQKLPTPSQETRRYRAAATRYWECASIYLR
jgi:hypothetical protein